MRIANRFAENVKIEFDDTYREENRAWQGAPTLARTKGGRLYVGFMSGGIYEPDPRNNSLLIYSDDDGDTWSEPVLSIESKPEINHRCFEFELWNAPDDSLWMFWAEVPYEGGLELPNYEQVIDMENDSEYHRLEDQTITYVSICRNPDDDEPVWSEPRALFNAVVRNHPIVTDSGRWIFSTYLTGPRDYYEFYYSDDQGQTFKTSRCTGRPRGRNYDEPGFYRMADGRIAAVVRITGPHYLRMISSDDGVTWSDPEPLLKAASQRPCVGNDLDGSVWMITSISETGRNGFRLMHSADGEMFEEKMILDDRERISYAEFAQAPDGTMYIAYDRERNNKIRKSRVTGKSEAAKEILFAKIPANVLKSGVPDEHTVRARVITKAGINDLNNRYTQES